MTKTITISDILDYEVSSSWWAKRVGVSWLQKLSGTYFSFKVKRKYRRYKHNKDMQALLKKLKKLNK